MRHRWVYIYDSPPTSSRFDELVDHFALNGITLNDPDTGSIESHEVRDAVLKPGMQRRVAVSYNRLADLLAVA